MKFSIKNFFSKCDHIIQILNRKLQIKDLELKILQNKVLPENTVVKLKNIIFVEQETLCDKSFYFHAVND